MRRLRTGRCSDERDRRDLHGVAIPGVAAVTEVVVGIDEYKFMQVKDRAASSLVGICLCTTCLVAAFAVETLITIVIIKLFLFFFKIMN